MFDAAHDHAPIVEAVAGRRVEAIVLTHGHNDHINSAVALRETKSTRRSCCTPATGCCGTWSTPTPNPIGIWKTGLP